MKNTVKSSFAALAMASLFVGNAAHATPVPTVLPSCSTSDVTLTTLFNMTAGTQTAIAPSLSSSACVGAFTNNAVPYPQQNLGYYQDGLFNGEAQAATGTVLFPNGIFSNKYVAYDLNNDGQVDPGWIRLVSWDTEKNTLELPTIGGVSGIQLASWFHFTGTGSSGTWSFKPDADVVSRVMPVLGSNLFDQFAISFKSGNSFAAYDFVGADLGLVTSADTIYGFSGNWDMSDTLINNGGQPAGLSHIDLYVRDPNGGQNVPEPAGLALLGLGLFGLSQIRRKRA